MLKLFWAICFSALFSLAPVALGTGAFAQTIQAVAPDYDAWEKVAKRAEEALSAGRASDEAFGNLRADVVGWRTQFQSQLSVNQSRIKTLNEQVAALGPVPADGATEAAEIAARRTELNTQLEVLTTPRRTAEEAFSRFKRAY